MLVWKLWTVYTGMFAVTAILSCVIKIRGLFKSTKCGRLKMSNLKLSQPGVCALLYMRNKTACFDFCFEVYFCIKVFHAVFAINKVITLA